MRTELCFCPIAIGRIDLTGAHHLRECPRWREPDRPDLRAAARALVAIVLEYEAQGYQCPEQGAVCIEGKCWFDRARGAARTLAAALGEGR